RPRIQAADQFAHASHAGVIEVQQTLQLGEVAIREQLQVPIDDFERVAAMRNVGRQYLQLQRQAFGAIARADARWLEALHVLERDRQLFQLYLIVGRKKLRDFLERRRQVAVLVERIDQRGDNLAIALRQVHRRELL